MTASGSGIRGAAPSSGVPLLGAQRQTRWDVPHATWFTLMGLGGWLFVLPRALALEWRLGTWLGVPVPDVLSFVVIAAGGLVLVADLGRPLRFLRAVARPRTSWISRGAIADFVFLACGGLLLLPALTVGGAQPLAGLPWDAAARTPGGRALEGLALLAAAVVVFYAGQVLADHAAIPYWRSPLVPLQLVLSSLAGAVSAVMALESLAGVAIGAAECGLLGAAAAALLLALVWHLRTAAGTPGKAESVEALVHGRLRWTFLGGAVGAGTLLPLGLAAVGVGSPAARSGVAWLALLLTLPAGFLLRLCTLRAGFLLPVTVPLGRRARAGG